MIDVNTLIKVAEPYTSPVDFKTIRPSTLSWAAVGDVDTATAREFAALLLKKADELDYSKLEVAPVESWRGDLPFEEAKLYCFSLNINGKIGWRLPTVYECEIIRKQSSPNLASALKHQNWVYTSTEPFYDDENYVCDARPYGTRRYEMPSDGPVTTYGFEDDEYDFEEFECIRSTIPVRDL